MFLTVLMILLIMQTCDAERIITTLKYSSHNVKPVIVNGEPVSGGAVPYIVSIKKPGPASPLPFYVFWNLCGGSIINTRKVLTAAHCFEADNFKYARDPLPLAVVAGDLRNIIAVQYFPSNKQTQWRRISKVIVHPFFQFPLNDLAMLLVLPNWEFSQWISPIKLARLAMDYPETCYAAGYGRTGHGKLAKYSEVLLRAKIDVIPRNECTVLWEVPMDYFVCSASVTTDVALGDSGGPLVCHGTSDPEEEPGKELLVGVTGGKNFDLTTIFLRISAYTEWIDKTDQNINFASRNHFQISYLNFFIIVFSLIHNS